jgi:hypothetical protein
MKALPFFKSVAAYCRQACTKSDRDPTVTGYTKLSRFCKLGTDRHYVATNIPRNGATIASTKLKKLVALS